MSRAHRGLDRNYHTYLSEESPMQSNDYIEANRRAWNQVAPLKQVQKIPLCYILLGQKA